MQVQYTLCKRLLYKEYEKTRCINNRQCPHKHSVDCDDDFLRKFLFKHIFAGVFLRKGIFSCLGRSFLMDRAFFSVTK